MEKTDDFAFASASPSVSSSGIDEDAALLSILKKEKDQSSATYQAAWKTLLDRHSGRIFRFAMRFVRNPTAADEVVQDTFMVLFKALKKNNLPSGVLLNWLFGVAARIAKKTRQKIYLKKKMIENVRKTATTIGIRKEADSTLDEAKRTASELLDQLPEKLRLPAVLYFTCGLKQEEIAAELRCSQGIVSSRLKTALERLRVGMNKKGFTSMSATIPALLAGLSLEAAPPIGAASLEKLVALPSRWSRAPGFSNSQGVAAIGGAKGLVTIAVIITIIGGFTASLYFQRPDIPNAASPSPAEEIINNSSPLNAAEEKILLSWDFDEPFAQAPEVVFPENIATTMYKAAAMASKNRKTDPQTDALWRPNEGRSGGALELNNHRAVVLPTIPPQKPFWVSFDFYDSSRRAIYWYSGIRLQSDGSILEGQGVFFQVNKRDLKYETKKIGEAEYNISEMKEGWHRMERLFWRQDEALFTLTKVNGTVLHGGSYEVQAEDDYRVLIGGHRFSIDNLQVRLADPEELDAMQSHIKAFLSAYDSGFKRSGK